MVEKKFRSSGNSEHADAYDVGKKLEKVRKDSVVMQRDYIKNLNSKSVEVNGTKVPLGNYLEAKNIISKLHLDVMDSADIATTDIGKHKGVFSVNIGGLVIDDKTLRKCTGVENTSEFTSGITTDVPEGDGFFKNSKGEVTGMNVIVSSVSKGGKKKPIATKVQRSKKGKLGKLSTVYHWSPEMQKCFKKNG